MMNNNNNQAGPSSRVTNQQDQRKTGFRRSWDNKAPRRPLQKPTTFAIPAQISSNEAATTTTTAGCSSSLPSPQPVVVAIDINTSNCPYPGWKLYFPEEKYCDSSPTIRRVKAIKTHFKNAPTLYDLPIIKKNFWFSLRLESINEDSNFLSSWEGFAEELNEKPEHVIAILGVAMHKLVSEIPDDLPFSNTPELSQRSSRKTTNLQIIRTRIEGYGPVLNLRSLKVNSYGKLICVRGNVIRAGASELLCTWLAFQCPVCGSEQAVRQINGIMTGPTSCKSGCRARSNFSPLLSSPYTLSEYFQIIRLQESMLGEQFNAGTGVPSNIEVELTEDLVDTVCPGDDITLTGILKVRPQEESQRKPSASLYKVYIRAITVSSNKNTINMRKLDFTYKDIMTIKSISEEPCPFRLFVHSLCPAIYGHDMVKAGLVLGLFGGSTQTMRRAEAHVLVVGDPGIGKSQMLQACANVSPRGVFVSGKSSSAAGLTVAVRHEKGGGVLDAGALVLADQGCCCIDEFDKMSSNHRALLEVMEQQTVSVAKAGILCKLPARTSILACANPCGGHYDRSKTVSENLKMSPALLSRFDLVFVLVDKPDEHLDSLLTDHIQALHSGTKQLPSGNKFAFTTTNIPKPGPSHDKSLLEHLRMGSNENFEILNHDLMQKYIVFARKNNHPKLSDEAVEEIKNFYSELRRIRTDAFPLPVTTRQAEALIRLTQARARVELALEASRKHALDVLEIVRHSMVDVFSTDDGVLEADRSINGSGMSQASQVKKFLKLLHRRSLEQNKTVYSVADLKQIAEHGCISANFSQTIDSLNIQGFLLKKSNNLYKFISE